MIAEAAPAKINLYLHVGGVRADGLHALASLFVFSETGDVVHAEPAENLSLTIDGPFAKDLAVFPFDSNLVWKAAELLQREFGVNQGAALRLEKNLPIAAGIGGGSADAAATLRALRTLWSLNVTDEALANLSFELGADVPACLSRAPVNVTGAGEVLSAGPKLPPLWVCLANPLVATPTGPIFKAFDRQNPAPFPPELARPVEPSYDGLKAALSQTRNDLEPFAVQQTPVIEGLLATLRASPGALMARMSGSGATCFALFASESAAARAAYRARATGAWSLASRIASG